MHDYRLLLLLLWTNSMPSLAEKNFFDSYLSEIKQTEIAFKQATGQNMEKIMRYPMGEYSKRTLEIMNDLGYKTYLWSATYDRKSVV